MALSLPPTPTIGSVVVGVFIQKWRIDCSLRRKSEIYIQGSRCKLKLSGRVQSSGKRVDRDMGARAIYLYSYK